MKQDRAVEGRVSGAERHAPFFGRARALAERCADQRFVFSWVKIAGEGTGESPRILERSLEACRDRCLQALAGLLSPDSALEKSWGSNIVFFTPLQSFDQDAVVASLRRALTHYSRNRPPRAYEAMLAASSGFAGWSRMGLAPREPLTGHPGWPSTPAPSRARGVLPPGAVPIQNDS